MDHIFAEAQMSVEKYTLNELSPEERTQFEEHMFDCPICSDLIRQNFTVAENLRDVLLEEKQAKADAANKSHRSGWRAWLTIPSLVPTAAALGLGGFLLSHNPGTEVAMTADIISPVATLRTASRGSAQVVHVDRASPSSVFRVPVDKLPDGHLDGELDNADGKKIMPVTGASKVGDWVEIKFSTRALTPGRFKLILRTNSRPDDTETYAFKVE